MGAGGRRLVPALGRDAWIVLGGDALSGIGTGLTLPFLLIYLHQVRGIDLSVAGLVVATVALASFAGLGTALFIELIAALGCVAVATRRLEARLAPEVNTIRA